MQRCRFDKRDIYFFSFVNHRTPFELNTASRWALMVLFESIVGVCGVCVVFTLTCLLIGSMIYVEACLLDIKSIFIDHIDPLSKRKDSELLLLEFCKEAVDLHERVNGLHILHSNTSYNFSQTLSSSFPLDSCVSWPM